MIIVAGYLTVDPADRNTYLGGCAEVVASARAAAGCLEFAIGADLVDPSRINVYERWSGRDELHEFRGSGPSSEQNAALTGADVREYTVDDE